MSKQARKKKGARGKQKSPTNAQIIDALHEARGFVENFTPGGEGDAIGIVGAAERLGVPVGKLSLRIRRSPLLRKEREKAALMACRGVIKQAAMIIGMTPEHLCRKVNADPDLEEARAIGKRLFVDKCFDVLDHHVNKKELDAAKFGLETLGKGEGFSKRFEITGPEGKAVDVVTHLYLPKKQPVDDGKGA